MEELAQSISRGLYKKRVISKPQISKVSCGLSILILFFIVTITIIAIAFFTSSLVYSLLFSFVFNFVRLLAPGFHCKKALNCYILSIGIYIPLPLLLSISFSQGLNVLLRLTIIVSLAMLFIDMLVERLRWKMHMVQWRYIIKRKGLGTMFLYAAISGIAGLSLGVMGHFRISLTIVYGLFAATLLFIINQEEKNERKSSGTFINGDSDDC